MSRKMRRRINDGALTGLKQDRFRNSDFEVEGQREPQYGEGVMRKTASTFGGAYEENRGRRNASERLSRRDDNPFENGRLYNWNHRKGWDRHFDGSYDKEANRPHGGALMDHDGSHFGKGPKGYKRPDESIQEDVCSALTMNPSVDATDVEVRVNNGIVYLEGTVDNREVKKQAELAIENISGVHDVQNLLSFKKTEEPQRLRPGVSEDREARH